MTLRRTRTTSHTAICRRTLLEAAAVGSAGLLLGCGDADLLGDPNGGSTASGQGAGGSGVSSSSTATGESSSTGAGGSTSISSSSSSSSSGMGGGGGDATCDPLPAECVETEDDPLGPYYREGAPFVSVLDNPSGAGHPLRIRGRVFAADCVTPLAGAIVEVWQADSNGDYDNENGDPGPNVWVMRGRIETDACGYYAFDSVMPGRYLNGPQYRPAHIHYRVSHPAAVTLVTQLYFQGDPYNEVDSMYKPSLEIALTNVKGVLQGAFDIVLAG